MASHLLPKLFPTTRISPSNSRILIQTSSDRIKLSSSSSSLTLNQVRSSSSSSPPPPSSRQDAIRQAKTCLSTSLQKPLNNPFPLLSRKLKKQRQPRYQVEIPILDDSPNSLVQLILDVFSDITLTKKGSSKPTFLFLWPNSKLADLALEAFNSSTSVLNSDLAFITSEALNAADIAVFSAPEASMLAEIRRVAAALDRKPVVLFNPAWAFEDEEKLLKDGFASFVSSFEVIYSFMGLEVKGFLSGRKGVVFRCLEDGVAGGEGWVVMVEEEKGELRVVSRFKRRPSIGEVENVMYNLMAANSPVTKSVKFLRELASSVTGKKQKQ